MKNKELLLGIDELTLVLRADKSVLSSIEDWKYEAESIITEFAELAVLRSIFGEKLPLEKMPQGYATGYKYGNNPFYFAIAFHPDFFQMGIACKFSAYAWAEYCHRWEKKYNENMNLYKFLNLVKSEDYSMRLSRVDFTADYINHSLVVDTIYRQLCPPLNELIIKDYRERINSSKMSAIETDKAIKTFYVGSRGANVNAFLRVYDKKSEQLETFGFRLTEAQKADDWVRFEAVFRGKYAHQLTEIIFNEVKSDYDLQELIANKITEKYCFYEIASGKPTDFTHELMEVPKNSFNILRSESPRDNDLKRTVSYIKKGSGLYPTLYKIEKIWGNKALKHFALALFADYKMNYTPNNDTRIWLNKHGEILSDQDMSDVL